METLLAALAALVGVDGPPPPAGAELSPREKAALVVVSGLPAPPGVGGVLVQEWNRDLPRPSDALVMADQEGGGVESFPELPPEGSAALLASAEDARASGKATGEALADEGVHVDLAPVLDAPDGPLGARHFREPSFGVAFAEGLAAGGVVPCVKHFPGLGSAAVSTDESPRVQARVREDELQAFRAAIAGGAPCVMLSHAFYERFQGQRALVSPSAYRLLRGLGFDGVAITDSLSVVRGPWPLRWAVRALEGGADMVLFTSPTDARAAMEALVPLARAGRLDAAVERVLALRREAGLPPP